MGYQTLTLEREGPLALLRLVRPDEGNPIDRRFLQELDDACAAISDDREVRVALLTADGDHFSTGWAPAELTGESFDAGEWYASRESSLPFAALEAMGQPVICAIHGDATGAGLELALACDVRLAAENARFSLPETGLGLLPMAGGTQRLARLAGRAEALRLILLGEEIDAAEALRIGLVSSVHPRDGLPAKAEALALRMASRGPLALRYAKEAVRRGLEQPLDQALRFETDLTVILQTTEDRAEGVRAFLEKREPKFKGR
ncbi:MAG: enoyl-CoA hydratase/isomerase family protein [Chloroflexi bacterium]|nr:enoyl-CoA hydratase/isomerase family protein [Chloroflexota bacterium]